MADEAAPLGTMAALGFVVPLPESITESDEEVQHSAQVPVLEHVCNSDNGEEAAAISIPTVQAEMAQIAAPDDFARRKPLFWRQIYVPVVLPVGPPLA